MPELVKKRLSDAVRRLMRPLAQLLIKQGIRHSEFTEITKHVFVETAARDFESEDGELSSEKIAVLTGLPSKEVERLLRDTIAAEPMVRAQTNQLATVLQAWHTDAGFIGPYGVPLELPWQSENDEIPSFTMLVRENAGQMSPTEVLGELLRTGAVVELEPHYYRVIRREYEPQSLDAATLERFGQVVENFLNTVVGNLYKTKPQGGKMERVVFTEEPIGPNQIALFDAWIKREGQRFLERIDDWFMGEFRETDSEELAATEKTAHTGLGIYHYVTETKEEQPFSEYLVQHGFSPNEVSKARDEGYDDPSTTSSSK